MRQGDEVESAASAANRKGATDYFIEFLERKELGDGEFADRNDELRLQEIDFIIHPGRTIPDLVRGGHAIAADRRFARKATADRREVNLRPDLFLAQPAELLEPPE